MAMFVKKLYIRVGKEVREGSFQIVTTMIFCFSLAIFIVILGMFINNRLKESSVYDELYYPQVRDYYPPPSSPSLHQLCNISSISLTSQSISSSLSNFISPKDLWHSLTDKELLWLASMVPRIPEYPYNRTPKVAFLFLSRGRLPLAPLWEMFFRGHENLFSVYLHTLPEFNNYDEPQESSAVFYKRRIPSKAVQWGKASMIDAERRLLANALLDLSNERFVLLSESCIPLFNFTTIYNYLVNSNQSYLSTFDDPRPIGRGRYNKRMWPNITLSDWRKGSQWFEVSRKLGIEIVSDVTVYPIFKNHCMPPCYMDEHYLPTLVNKICPELTSNRTITWTDWTGGGSHPTTFKRNDVTETFLDHIRFGFNNCSYNNGEVNSSSSSPSICHLFARKFHPNTLQPLLKIAPSLLGFGS